MAVDTEVKVGHLLLSLMRGLSDKALKWTALLLSFAAGATVLYRPNPIRAAMATLIVAAFCPLWLRRGPE